MENMHLFTSLMILSLAISINSRCPGIFHQTPEDTGLYDAGKEVLRYMMHSGSMAAKGYLNMLKDVEDLGSAIAMGTNVDVNQEWEQWEQWNVDEWMQLFEGETTNNLFESGQRNGIMQ